MGYVIMEVKMLLRVSEAVAFLRREKGINYTEAGLYRLLYRGKLAFTQRADIGGQGAVRPGGRIMIAQADLEKLFVHHPAND